MRPRKVSISHWSLTAILVSAVSLECIFDSQHFVRFQRFHGEIFVTPLYLRSTSWTQSGIVGATGNLGGVINALVFRFQPAPVGKPFWIVGIMAVVCYVRFLSQNRLLIITRASTYSSPSFACLGFDGLATVLCRSGALRIATPRCPSSTPLRNMLVVMLRLLYLVHKKKKTHERVVLVIH